MSCPVEQGSKQIVFSQGSCIECRNANTGTVRPKFIAAHYEKCSLVTRNCDAPFDPALPLESVEKQFCDILGVIECPVDLTGATEADLLCNYAVTTGVSLNVNKICWPDGTTQEQIDNAVANSKPGDCVNFVNVCEKTPLPEKYASELEAAKAAEKSAA